MYLRSRSNGDRKGESLPIVDPIDDMSLMRKITTLIKSKRSKFVSASFVSAMFLGITYVSWQGSSSSNLSLQSTPIINHSFHVVCYGDSFTAGVSPPLTEKSPYGPSLRESLNDMRKSRESHNGSGHPPPVVVTWRGVSEYTADRMVRNANSTQLGIRPFVRHNPAVPDVAVILAGTHDLGKRRSIADIVGDIISLHRMCFQMGIRRTLAVGIPPSAFLAADSDAASNVTEVNEGLKSFCNISKESSREENVPKSTAKFIDFPFPFEEESDLWAPDGLHMTPYGYKELGKALSDPIEGIFMELRQIKREKHMESNKKG